MTTGTSGTGASTPKIKVENVSILSQSRPASPLSLPPVTQNPTNDPTVLSAALQKKISRKRKIVDNEVCLNLCIVYFKCYMICKLNRTLKIYQHQHHVRQVQWSCNTTMLSPE